MLSIDTATSILLAKCAVSLVYQEVDITDMYHGWTRLHGICRWLKRYGNAKMNAVEPTDIAECIYGLKETVFIAILKQY